MSYTRIYKFDNIKVWCMVLVVIAHTLINSYGCVMQEMIRFFCLCYTMPMFTFISGWFSKEYGPLKKNIHGLLLPCIMMTLVNDGIQLLVNPNYHFDLKTPGFAMWYLWALFVYRLSLPFLLKIPYVVIWSFLLSWIAGFIPQIDSTFSLSRIICFLPYFLLGYTMRKHKDFSQIVCNENVKDCKWGGVTLTLIFAFWIAVIYLHPGLTIATGFNYGYGLSLKGLILRIALQATILVAGYWVIRIFPSKKVWFTKYGARTINVYLWHSIIVLPFAYKVFSPMADATLWQCVLMIIIPTGICLLLFSERIDKFTKEVLKRL